MNVTGGITKILTKSDGIVPLGPIGLTTGQTVLSLKSKTFWDSISLTMRVHPTH